MKVCKVIMIRANSKPRVFNRECLIIIASVLLKRKFCGQKNF